MERQVLPHRQLAVKGKGLGHIADAPPGLDILRVHRPAEEPGFPFTGRQEARQHLHGGGLAAAVGPQETEDLTLPDAEAHGIDGGEIAETHGEIVGFDGGFTGGSVRLSGRDDDRPVSFALGCREQGDEGLLQGGRAGRGQEFHRGPRGEHAPGVHGNQPVEPGGLFHVGGGHDDAHVGLPGTEAVDEFPELPAGQRIDAGGGFIEDQQVGVVNQGAAEAQLLLHAAGELACGTVGKGGQPRRREQLANPPLALLAAMAEEPSEKIGVLKDGKRWIEVFAQSLRHVGDPWTGGAAVAGIGHVASQHGNPARLDLPRAGYQREQAGLSHPVGTDEADHGAGGQVEGNLVQGRGLAVAQADLLKLCHGPGWGEGYVNGRIAGFHWTSFSLSRGGQSARGSSRT
ncbi:MAG: hypothetical protein A4E72_02136 [Syntrophus sp. PtaU1.Bin208]|nr:MAG: hypothetical protein A4E72_02136 [Syntrophus sp. PtaU1.Bin208]